MNVLPIIGRNKDTIGGLDYELVMKILTLYLMAVLYVLAGSLHFVKPKMYLRIMPPYLPENIYMLQKGGEAFRMSDWVLWVRLPLQIVLMAWAFWYT
jgi:uncharacterized membrane protein